MNSPKTAPLARLALLARQAWEDNDAVAGDPIAIVGMACRMPRAGSLDEYWQLLASGTDAVEEVPASRWPVDRFYDSDPQRAGRMNTRWGSFLPDVDAFDAAFFGIPAREAAAMDPQHRILLEVACEALDDAGQTASALQASATGVFVSVYNADYFQRLHAERSRIGAYATSGTLPGMAAGRLSYHFDLRGPNLIVETACSSSLVAVHQACQSLRARTSALAVAGGVSLVLGPDRSISLSKWGFMAPDGRCKPFDASADGWVRGEGCGIVVLRRLADALAAGDRVHAVIRGTAINHDGRSTVMTAPNGAAQIAVIQQALIDGRVAPEDIGYVEAHGTGTAVGDPIEFEALDDAVGRGSEEPCYVGAVKANIGHLEAAAGVAGLIKTVLALQRERIPPQIHFSRLNPLLSFERTRLRVSPVSVAWPARPRRRFAGVSAFGFSGTNAHVVVEEAPVLPEPPPADATAHLLLLSAKSPASLDGAARAFARALSVDGALAEARLADVCFTAGVRRHQHDYRLAVTAASRDQMRAGLEAFLSGTAEWNVARGIAAHRSGDAVLVFSGNAPLQPDAGGALRRREPHAQQVYDECRAILSRLQGASPHGESANAVVPLPQSCGTADLLVLQLSLAAAWRAWGLNWAAVVGYGPGELAAAHIRGELTLEEALRAALAGSRCTSATGVDEPAGFAPVVAALVAAGHRRFVEVGPHPVLRAGLVDALGGRDGATVVGSLHRDREDVASLLAAAGELHASGAALDIRALLPRARVIGLPGYVWDRQRYWAPEFDAAQRRVDDEPRPSAHAVRDLVEREIITPWSTRRVFEVSLSAACPSWASDHRVGGRLLFPAAAFLALAASAASRVHAESVELDDVVVAEPLVVREEPSLAQVGVNRDGDGGTFEIVSQQPAAPGGWLTHVTGRYRVRRGPLPALSHTSSLSLSHPEHRLDTATFYARLAAAGTEFGPSFRKVTAVDVSPSGATVTVDASPSSSAGNWPHPVVLDACLQAAWAAVEAEGATIVPVTFGRVACDRQAGGLLTVKARGERAADNQSWVVSLEAHDEAGQPVLIIERAVLRRLVGAAAPVSAPASHALQPYRLEWVSLAPWSPAPAVPASWLVIGGPSQLATKLEQLLLAHGHRCQLLSARRAAPDSRHPLHQVLGDALRSFVAATPGPRGLLNLDAIDVPVPAPADDLADDALQRVCGTTLALLQAAGDGAGAFTELVVVTRGAQAVDSTVDANPLQALAWGMARATDLEYPDLRCRRIDLGPAGRDDAKTIVEGLSLASHVPELAWREGRWRVPRLRTAAVAPDTGVRSVLEIGQRGSLDGMTLSPRARVAPAPGRLELRVLAAGLNFRDVLNVLGMYPGDAGALGNECVGVVTAIGAGVENLAVGDRVVALGTECLATHVIVDANTAVPLPATLDPVEAATIPITFLTADYALHDCAAIGPGDRVLVHAGAGGVGIAAIQIALRAGARVYATAGSEEKREYLRSLGVLHVADSRSLGFADDLRRATGGAGVEVVLNSLAGEFIPRSLDLLGPNGRFVEIGKTDVWDEQAVRRHRPDVRYAVLFLGDIIRRSPEDVAARLRCLLDECARGTLRPLPRRTFGLERAANAFRFMARARHIGKVVLAPTSDQPWRVRPNGAYLVAGGTGAMGLQAARWLVERGARHIVLASRSGDVSHAGDIAALRERASVAVEQCDLTSWAEVERLMSRFGRDWPELRGLIHAAGTLRDGMLAKHTWPSFRAGLDVKVAGAWHLHRATHRAALDFALTYSSLAGVIGSMGQASYCAANAFLDALTGLQRSEGLPAAAIAWGTWGGGGMAARLQQGDRARWEADGVLPLSPQDSDAVLDRLSFTGESHLVAARVDWRRYVDRHPMRMPLIDGLPIPPAPASERRSTAAEAVDLWAGLARLRPAERHPAIVQGLRARVLQLVGLPETTRVDEHRGFRDVGLDSLLAVELRNSLQHDIGHPLPATIAFECPTLASLADYLLRHLGLDRTEPVEPFPTDGLSGDLRHLSDEEAEALLEQELSALERKLGMQ
jgi:acyl transferase domain-containing protein/NADP-dependent 3-hydroxy acid dehydrogenase YdfG